MKAIVIDLPDALLAAADKLADRLGMSRNGLCVTALDELVRQHSDAAITDRLTALYAIEDSSPDPVLHRMQRESIGGEMS